MLGLQRAGRREIVDESSALARRSLPCLYVLIEQERVRDWRYVLGNPEPGKILPRILGDNLGQRVLAVAKLRCVTAVHRNGQRI